MIPITKDFYWIGAQDPTLRVFDIIMETEFGTSYNSYLLKGTSSTGENEFILFETVKDMFWDEFIEKLNSNIDINDIKYLVVNHTEPDHVGSVAKLLELLPMITIIASTQALNYLKGITNAEFKSMVAKENNPLTIGGHTLHFKNVPFLHWPDTIYTYIADEQILVTCDSFGAHYSSKRIFFSDLEEHDIKDFDVAYEYYYNMIMGPFKRYVLAALKKIENLDIEYVCPGHGLIFNKSNFNHYRDLYAQWSESVNIKKNGIVIAYVSSYGYTAKIAKEIHDGILFVYPDMAVSMFDLAVAPIGEVLEAVGTAQGLLVGSPTILGDTLPPVWQLAYHLRSKMFFFIFSSLVFCHISMYLTVICVSESSECVCEASAVSTFLCSEGRPIVPMKTPLF